MGNASTYNGFYLRDNLASDGEVPALAPYNQCPDIIQSPTAVSDPESAFSTPASWDETYQTAPMPGENYYYVRGLNGSQQAFSGELSLFCIPAELLLFPALWKNSPLQTASGSETVPAVHAAPGHIGVGAEPFVLQWPTPSRAHSAETFPSFIAQNTAQPIPTINSWIQLSQLMTQQLNFGWRNTVTFDPLVNEGMMLHEIGLTIPRTVGKSGQIQLMLTLYGFIGDTVSLIADRYTPEQKPIQILPTRVTQDGQSLGLTVTLNPGFAGHLTVQYWNTSAKVPAAGSTITLSANYIVPHEQHASAVAAGVLDSQYSAAIGRSLLGASLGAAQPGVTPQQVAPVGAATFIATPSARDAE
jgi:hypothetical protein